MNPSIVKKKLYCCPCSDDHDDGEDEEGIPVCSAAGGASRHGKRICRNTPVAYGGYEDQDKGNVLVEFKPSRPLGIHFNPG